LNITGKDNFKKGDGEKSGDKVDIRIYIGKKIYEIPADKLYHDPELKNNRGIKLYGEEEK
jgi:hypothetical protein